MQYFAHAGEVHEKTASSTPMIVAGVVVALIVIGLFVFFLKRK